jgi:hypothetical protein
MFPVKQLLHFLTHDLWCRTCNPFVQRRRREHVADAQAGGDMAYFRNLLMRDRVHQRNRLAILRRELLKTGADPWEADLLVKAVDEYRQGRRNIIVAAPYQHPMSR